MPRGLKISHKLFILVAVPLAFELGFVAVLNHLLEQAELEREREAEARAIISKVNSVHRVVLNTVAGMASLTIIGSDLSAPRDRTMRDDFDKELPELERLVKNKPVEYAHFKRAMELVDRGANQLRVIKRVIRHGGEGTIKDHLQTFKPILRELSTELDSIMEEERKIEQLSPIIQSEQRARVKAVLLAAVVFNVVLAVLLVLYLSRSITSRLGVLVDNSMRFARREPLNPSLSGNDELSHLDSVFKDMATIVEREEEMIRVAEARMRLILESLPVGLAILNRQGVVELANQTLADMLDKSKESLTGHDVTSLVSSILPDQQLTMDILLEKAKGHEFECTGLKREGTIPVEMTLREMESIDGPRYIAIILDITERHEVARLKQNFISMVSHDLRTPLTSVQNYIELLGQGIYGKLSKSGEDRRRALDRSISRLVDLVQDLLDLDRWEAGQLRLQVRATTLKSIVDQSLESVQGVASKHEIKIDVPEENKDLLADRDRIIQVLVNLLSNAVKFTPHGGTILISTKDAGDQLRIEVIDQGPGIPLKFQSAIFDRFKQVSDEDTHQRGGTGLGLAISKAIIEQHGGKIGVISKEGEGSTFWFTVPMKAQPVDETLLKQA